MIAKQAVALAEYNRWMNERLYDACSRIGDAERKKDRGAFFRSIHGTLDHLLLADRLWMSRFRHEEFKISAVDEEQYSSFADLEEARERLDASIIAWAETLTDEALASPLRFTSAITPGPKLCPLWVAVTHFFNHQAHHRGQLTTLMAQAGIDYGVTDFIWMPGAVSDGDG